MKKRRHLLIPPLLWPRVRRKMQRFPFCRSSDSYVPTQSVCAYPPAFPVHAPVTCFRRKEIRSVHTARKFFRVRVSHPIPLFSIAMRASFQVAQLPQKPEQYGIFLFHYRNAEEKCQQKNFGSARRCEHQRGQSQRKGGLSEAPRTWRAKFPPSPCARQSYRSYA